MISSFGPPSGHLELTNAVLTPLLWAAAASGADILVYNGSTSVSLARNAPACTPQGSACDVLGYDVLANVRGNEAVVAPNGAADVGDYHVVTGALVTPSPSCADYFGPPFAAGAVKLP